MIPVKIIRKTKQGKGESKGVSSSGAYRPVGELLTLQEQVAGLTNTLALLHKYIHPYGEEGILPWSAPASKVQALEVTKGIFSVDFLSARGRAGTSGAGPGGAGFGLYTDTSWNTAIKTTDALSASLGKEIRDLALSNQSAVTELGNTVVTLSGTVSALSDRLDTHTHSQYVTLGTEQTITAAKTFQSAHINFRHNDHPNGGNALGVSFFEKNAGTRHFGIGSMSNNNTPSFIYIGWGSAPWEVTDNLAVSSDRFTYKDNPIFHAGGDILFKNSGTAIRQIRFTVGGNDYARIAAGAAESNAGWMEMATADDGNEPIYVRQYSGAYTTVRRTLTLLDASGNTVLPGTLLLSKAIQRTINGSNRNVMTVAAGTPNTIIFGDAGEWSMLRGGEISFQNVSGTTVMKIREGKVGIGTTTPLEKLHINGKVRIGSVTLEDVDGTLKVSGGIWSPGFVSARGQSAASGGGPSGGGGVRADEDVGLRAEHHRHHRRPRGQPRLGTSQRHRHAQCRTRHGQHPNQRQRQGNLCQRHGHLRIADLSGKLCDAWHGADDKRGEDVHASTDNQVRH